MARRAAIRDDDGNAIGWVEFIPRGDGTYDREEHYYEGMTGKKPETLTSTSVPEVDPDGGTEEQEDEFVP